MNCYNPTNPFNHHDCLWGPHHGGDMETELLEIELGDKAAFDLFHLDAVTFFLVIT